MNKRVLMIIGVAALSATLYSCSNDPKEPTTTSVIPTVSKVFDYNPAPGQHINTMPIFEDNDTKSSYLAKVEELVTLEDNTGLVSLGGFGGSIEVGFDYMVENRPNSADFRVFGNAFENSVMPNSGKGSYEPGIIMVGYDHNGNGKPDEGEWYEIVGSEDSNTIKNYEITYHRPTDDSGTPTKEYIRWSDNQGGEGWLARNQFMGQSYYPMWETAESLTFSGTRLPDNAENTGTAEQQYWILNQYDWGYADNGENDDVISTIDIDWAVDASGNKANLEGIHFLKIYTGIRQEAGVLGEVSTDFAGAKSLHTVEVEI